MDDAAGYRAPKWKGLLWVGLASLLAFGFARGLAPLAHAVPWAWERDLAPLVTHDLKPRLCRDAAGEAALRTLVARLYPLDAADREVTIDVHLVKKREVNAFAGPGGQIVLYSGLIEKAQSAEEVAGVLAHEIAHVRERHILESAIVRIFTGAGMALLAGDASYADWSRYFLSLRFSRRQEHRADVEAFRRLAAAEVDAAAMVRFFERLAQDERLLPPLLSDHPAAQERAALAAMHPPGAVRPVLSPEAWQALRSACR